MKDTTDYCLAKKLFLYGITKNLETKKKLRMYCHESKTYIYIPAPIFSDLEGLLPDVVDNDYNLRIFRQLENKGDKYTIWFLDYVNKRGYHKLKRSCCDVHIQNVVAKGLAELFEMGLLE